VVAEMLGVKSGLGWYLTWAQGWASYPNMYGALLVMALLFSGVITLLFTVRDRVLSWQKGWCNGEFHECRTAEPGGNACWGRHPHRAGQPPVRRAGRPCRWSMG
jgi:hypothetical protein